MSEFNEERYREFLEFTGDKVADPEVFPKVYEHQVKMFLYQKKVDARMQLVVKENSNE